MTRLLGTLICFHVLLIEPHRYWVILSWPVETWYYVFVIAWTWFGKVYQHRIVHCAHAWAFWLGISSKSSSICSYSLQVPSSLLKKSHSSADGATVEFRWLHKISHVHTNHFILWLKASQGLEAQDVSTWDGFYSSCAMIQVKFCTNLAIWFILGFGVGCLHELFQTHVDKIAFPTHLSHSIYTRLLCCPYIDLKPK